MDFSKYKLFIFDLDETLWNGVLSEGTAVMSSDHIELIKNMVDAGVMCSICSKNDHNVVRQFLEDKGIFDLFVFPSINWSPKGIRVKQIVDEMNLRPENIMFLDDNATNRSEVQSICRNISVADADVMQDLVRYFGKITKKDLGHNRLFQYKILEQKSSFKATTGSNEEFLQQCNIKVVCKNDCMYQLERIAELVLRSNQLNFTKVRSTADELIDLFKKDDIDCGYVLVSDDFGDYGVTGFYAVKEGELLHFVFSCRVLNMGVEQYVYQLLGRPRLTIVGNVSSDLYQIDPVWINQNRTAKNLQKTKLGNQKILIKGPCDMLQIFSFIKQNENIVTEFVYVNDRGSTVEQINHTSHIVQAYTLSESEKKRLIKTVPFADEGMFSVSVYEDYQFILLSLFTDPSMGVYKEKSSGAVISFGEYIYDVTDERLWQKYLDKEIYTAKYSFTLSELQYMKDNFDFLGRLSPEEIVANVDFIYQHLHAETKLILSLGVEMPFEKNSQPAYEDRHLFNKKMNQLIKQWSEGKKNVILLDVNEFITSQDAFVNNINHFTKQVYYQLSREFIRIVQENGESCIESKTVIRYLYDKIVGKIKYILKKGFHAL